MPVDGGPLLLVGPQLGGGAREVVQEQVAVLDLGVRGPAVLEAAGGLQPVEQARVLPRDHVLHDAAAGAAVADGEADRGAVRLDDVLLEHRQGLGRDRLVDVLAVHEQAVVRDRVAAGQRRVVQHGRRRARAVVGARARAEGHEQLVVPGRQGRLLRVEQHRDEVVAAVLHAVLGPHDVAHRLALVGRRAGDGAVAGRVGRVVVAEQPGDGVLVGVRVGHRGAALRVLGRAVAARGVVAQPRLHLRTGEHRSALRVVGQPQRGAAPVGQHRPQRALPDPQPRHEAAQPRRAHLLERRRDAAPVDGHPRVAGRHPRRHVDLHQGVAAADEVGAAGQHLDPDRPGRGGRGGRTRREQPGRRGEQAGRHRRDGGGAQRGPQGRQHVGGSRRGRVRRTG